MCYKRYDRLNISYAGGYTKSKTRVKKIFLNPRQELKKVFLKCLVMELKNIYLKIPIQKPKKNIFLINSP